MVIVVLILIVLLPLGVKLFNKKLLVCFNHFDVFNNALKKY